ncbi:MAG: Rrf2 family transcriptional regulator [Epsilonproteobacteria bacterium]|nr:Rrf2 family transcriptional regulator [Campylobacterota bacterium]
MITARKSYITREADYAIRLVAYLGSKDELSHTADIAQKLKIPKPFLVRIVNKLVLNDIIISQKGRRGGIKLSRPADKINLYDVLVALEAYRSMNLCILSPQICSLNPICKISPALRNIENEFAEKLKTVTMEKLIFEDKDLKNITD